MQQLVKVTQGALASEEARSRDIHQRNRVSDSLRLLHEHGAALVKGYPMALLEIFAQGPAQARGGAVEASGMDFGELSLLDDNELQAQVELSKAQQSALHATDAVLAEARLVARVLDLVVGVTSPRSSASSACAASYRAASVASLAT